MRKILLSLAVLVLSCQTVQRIPASQDDATLLREELVTRLMSQEIEALKTRAKNQNSEVQDLDKNARALTELQTILTQKKESIAIARSAAQKKLQAAAVAVPKLETYGFHDRWRAGDESFMVPHVNFVKKDPQGRYKTFFVNDLEARSLTVNLRQQILMAQNEDPGNSLKPYLDTTIKCAEPFTVSATFGTKRLKANETAMVRWYDYKIKEQIVLGLTETFTSCEVRFKKTGDKEIFGFQLEPESKLMSSFEFVQNNVGTCILPDGTGLGSLEALFMTDVSGNFTCPKKVGKIRSLEDSEVAMNAKIKALLGHEFSQEEIEGNDPYTELALSNMPKLDAIFISSLVFRGDFYGTVIRRLLEIHASRGTQVRILMSDTTAESGDYWRLWDSMAALPNIKMVPFRYKPQGLGLSDSFSQLHRSMHTKLFATFSKSNPEANIAIFGGRNIADPYAFMKPKDLSAYNLLSQYNPSKWLRFDDYEVEIQDPAFVRDLMAQYLTFYNLDQASMNARNLNVNLKAGPLSPDYFKIKPTEALVRNLFSFPFRGDASLEDFYVQAFNAAQNNLRISSPYFSPTKRIGEAMERAADRGVKIEIITGLKLEGDTAGSFLGEVNKTATNKFLGKVSMYSYSEKKTVLHSKLVIIDDRVVLMGSVNLNQRSFFHDSENSLMIYSPDYAKYLTGYFEGYKAKSAPLTEQLKATYWKKILTGLFKKDF